MKVIRAGLKKLIGITPPQVNFDELKVIGNVLNKINYFIVPEVKQYNELSPTNHEFEQLEY